MQTATSNTLGTDTSNTSIQSKTRIRALLPLCNDSRSIRSSGKKSILNFKLASPKGHTIMISTIIAKSLLRMRLQKPKDSLKNNFSSKASKRLSEKCSEDHKSQASHLFKHFKMSTLTVSVQIQTGMSLPTKWSKRIIFSR